MSLQRFYVSPGTLDAEHVRLEGDVAWQISRVLRRRVGDSIVLFDGHGGECVAKLTEFPRNEVLCEIITRRQGIVEPEHRVDVYLALLNKPEKFEWALQKCTELGANRIVPVICERSVVASPEPTRYKRWERIVSEAAEQSGRTVLPELSEALRLAEALSIEEARLQAGSPGEHILLAPALGARRSLSDALSETSSVRSVSLVIGPEGGLTDDELSIAERSGAVLVNLGPRTLRAETAVVATLAVVMYALRELSGAEDSHSIQAT
jgi:16S rRNA (uracil1498-N3)-methyltransferase